jgi:predicted O-methyltransferase YrrM
MQWVEDRRTRRTPIDRRLPWFSYSAIETLAQWLRPDMSVFEWGGGGSTLYFAGKGCRVTTVESHAGWAGKMRKGLEELGLADRVEIRDVAAETQNPQQIREYVETFADGGPWDVVVIDGLEERYLSRMDCVRFVAAHPNRVARGGCVIIDDAWRPAYEEAPRILSMFRHQACWGLGPCRMGVTRTDLYWNDR